MKKIKAAYLLLGMGIGIILVSNLYFLFPRIQYIELSDEIIIEKAKELGYISLKDNINKRKEDLAPKDSIDEDRKESIESVESGNAVNKEEEILVEVEIKEGDNLSDIADKLYKANLIEDKEKFIDLSEDKTVDKNFAYGIFKIKNNSSYDTIINLLKR